MLKPALPPDETVRLASLRALSILDTPAEERFDRITRVTAHLFDVPMALISLVDTDRQWFKSCQGVSASETSREISFCAHAILGDHVFYVSDTHADSRFADNPLVTRDPFLRFYAGYPIPAPGGHKIGTLCIMDRKPRAMGESDFGLLRDLAEWAHLELTGVQILRNEIAKQTEKLQESETTFFNLMEGLPVGVFVLTADGRPYYVNQTAQQIWGKGVAPGATPEDVANVYPLYIAGTNTEYPLERRPSMRALEGRTTAADDLEIHHPGGVIQLQAWGTPVYYNGKITHAVVAFQDIIEQKRSQRRVDVQHAVTAVLSDSESLEEATPRILEAICSSMKWQVGAIWTIDETENCLRCVDLWHRPDANVQDFDALTRKFPMPAGVGLPGRIWTSGEPAWVPDIVEDKNFPRTPAALKNGLHAAFGFPIYSGRQIAGIMEFFSHQIQQPDKELLSMMSSLGSQIGQFLSRKRIEAAFRTSEEKYRELVEKGPD